MQPHFNCILGICTGRGTPWASGGSVGSEGFRQTTDTEDTVVRALRRFEAPHDCPPVYFRLNVEHGMKAITLAEWRWLGEITAHTRGEVRRKVERVVEALRKGCGAQISCLYLNSTNHPRYEAATARLSPGTIHVPKLQLLAYRLEPPRWEEIWCFSARSAFLAAISSFSKYATRSVNALEETLVR